MPRKRARLSPNQLQAIPLLLSGWTIGKVAEHVKCSRASITRWVERNGLFQAALQDSLQDYHRAAKWRVCRLSAMAAKGLQKVLRGDNHSAIVQAARTIFEMTGMLKGPDNVLALSIAPPRTKEELRAELQRLQAEVLQIASPPPDSHRENDELVTPSVTSVTHDVTLVTPDSTSVTHHVTVVTPDVTTDATASATGQEGPALSSSDPPRTPGDLNGH